VSKPGASRISAVLGGSAGNLVEWFDWYIYSANALYFAPIFFPKGDQTAQLLQTAAVFAVGFLARPLGAWLMGRYADRVGRKIALTLSVTMMCGGSLAIAVTPGAATIGDAAPIALLLARVFQGLSLGGEYGASATYISEMAGRKYRGFWSSFHYVTLIGGQLTALAVLIVLQHLLPKAAMAQWGWRIPFVIGAALAMVAYWLRRRIQESQFGRGSGRTAPSRRIRVADNEHSGRKLVPLRAGRRRLRDLLRLYDLYAEVFDQHQRIFQGSSHRDQRSQPDCLHDRFSCSVSRARRRSATRSSSAFWPGDAHPLGRS
jgi:MHS family alpha-ketoglutarate permease-like MFS transporter